MRLIEIRLDTHWLLIGSAGAFDRTMLNAADHLAPPGVIRMLERDSRVMAMLRSEFRRIYTALPASSLRDQDIVALLQRELHARRLIAIVLRESSQAHVAAPLTNPAEGIVNLPLDGSTLLIARQGSMPAQFLQSQASSSSASTALSQMMPMSQPIALLEKQAQRLSCVPEDMRGAALAQFVETQVGQGQLHAVTLTDPHSRMAASQRTDAPKAITSLDWAEKIAEAITRSRKHLKGEVLSVVDEMIKPENLAMMAVVILAVAAAQVTPVTAALVDSTLLMLALMNGGPGAVAAIGDLIRATKSAMEAQHDREMNAAARLYAVAFIGLGAAVLSALMRRVLKVKGGKSEESHQAKMNQGTGSSPKTGPRSPSGNPPSGQPAKPKSPQTKTSQRPSHIPSRTQPSSNASGLPAGTPTNKPPNADRLTKRGIDRENESAQALARKGYRIEQNPVLPDKKLSELGLAAGKKPDYLIEGKVFDNYAPTSGSAAGVLDGIGQKVGSGQTRRVVVNLSDSSVTPGELQSALKASPVSNLQEIITIGKDGVIRHTFP